LRHTTKELHPIVAETLNCSTRSDYTDSSPAAGLTSIPKLRHGTRARAMVFLALSRLRPLEAKSIPIRPRNSPRRRRGRRANGLEPPQRGPLRDARSAISFAQMTDSRAAIFERPDELQVAAVCRPHRDSEMRQTADPLLHRRPFHDARPVTLFYLAAVPEKGNIVARGLDPQDEPELVVHFDGNRTHVVFDPGALDAGMKNGASPAPSCAHACGTLRNRTRGSGTNGLLPSISTLLMKAGAGSTPSASYWATRAGNMYGLSKHRTSRPRSERRCFSSISLTPSWFPVSQSPNLLWAPGTCPTSPCRSALRTWR
jgi:hypothetical protein